jgi:DNA mismatch endonuclease (patch repair protein)
VPRRISNNQLERTTFGGLSRSALMSRIRSRGNATTEVRMLRLLRRAGLTGWRRHFPVMGHPDFCWPRERVAVFVHGCFWHGHNCGRNLSPKSNSKSWSSKLKRNRQRDLRVVRTLRRAGWAVFTIWECQLSKMPESCIRRIARRLLSKQATLK